MRRRPNLSDLEAALAEYAQQQVEEHGRGLEEVVAELVRGGCRDLTVEQLQGWMSVAGRVVVEEDPLAGERDEARRAEAMEARLMEAAECVPGAADLLGLERLQRDMGMGDGAVDGEMAEIIVKALDFLVPELMQETLVLRETTVVIPHGGRWEVWDGGQRRVVASTLAIFDEGASLVGLRLRTRPKGNVFVAKGATVLRVRTAELAMRADLRGVAQRLLQLAAEFRSGRHGRVSQLELAQAVGRTKQAISSQRLKLVGKIKRASGGRAGFRGVRNLRKS